jgi:glycerophosphoryl diester phosphodiesterase
MRINRTPYSLRPNHPLASKLLLIAALVGLFSGCYYILSLEELFPLPQNPSIARLETAHRGSLHSKDYPSWENSLPALKSAVSARVPFLEVDLRLSDNQQIDHQPNEVASRLDAELTNDRDLFLFHDSRLRRNNSFAPRELYGRSIQSLSRAERESVSLDRNRFVEIPTLDQAIGVVMQEDSQSSLQLDLKGESDRLALRALDVIARRGALRRVLLQIRDVKRIERIKSSYPTARILARCTDIAQVENALALGVEVVELERWISEEALLKAHAHRALVLINVASSRFDNLSSWSYLRSRGVDVIMTDHAALARYG